MLKIIINFVSISAFASLVFVPVGIMNSAVGIKLCAITAGIKKHKLFIKKKKSNHDKVVLLGKNKLNTMKVLISKALIDLYISHNEFVSINNVLKEDNEMKEEIKKSWNFQGIQYINMIDISRKTYERNDIETIIDNDGILWLNEKSIGKGLDHDILQ